MGWKVLAQFAAQKFLNCSIRKRTGINGDKLLHGCRSQEAVWGLIDIRAQAGLYFLRDLDPDKRKAYLKKHVSMLVCLNPITFTGRYIFSHTRAYGRQSSKIQMGQSGSDSPLPF